MPSSTTPPPPPTSNSSTYVVGGVVMLFLMGGLLWWKMGKSEPEPNPAPSAPKVEKKAPVLAVAPPPPPPEEPKDAGPEASDKKVVKSGPARSPCAGTCDGVAPAALRSALAAAGARAKPCYERALRQNPTLQGKLMVAVSIGPRGQVCSANVTTNTLGDPGIASCVSQIFRSAQLPAPQGGCVNTQVPLNFMPKL